MEALEAESERLSKVYGRLSPETVFVGGGTPTLLEPSDWERLGRALARNFDLQNVVEWSVEGNPESVRRAALEVMRQIGVNRFSLGMQTADNTLLEKIGRIHVFGEVESAVEHIRAVGFDNLNLDLMTGLPGQTLESVEATLDAILPLNPEHLSSYGLKVEEGTRFGQLERQGKLILPDEALEREMEYKIRSVLAIRGYHHYEISNYAKPGRECRHNLNYWNCGSYAALGLSAHGYLEGVRYENTSEMADYLESIRSGQLPVIQRETINMEEDEKEWLMLRLRLSDGVIFSDYQNRYGKNFLKEKETAIQFLGSSGLIELTPDRLRLTEKGFDFANTVIVEFI
jgi:oxygen-independent coproporphyrinogen-3 oxidase